MAPQIIGHSAIKLFANGNFYKKNKSGNFFRGHFPAPPHGRRKPIGAIRPHPKIRGAALSDVRWENFSRGPTVSGPKPGQGAPPRYVGKKCARSGGSGPAIEAKIRKSGWTFARVKMLSVGSRSDFAVSVHRLGPGFGLPSAPKKGQILKRPPKIRINRYEPETRDPHRDLGGYHLRDFGSRKSSGYGVIRGQSLTLDP